MSLYINAGWSTAGSAQAMTATVAGNAATIASGTYAHATMSSVMGGTNYSAFAAAVKTSFDAAASSTFTVTWSSTTYLYTISRATNFTLAFSSASDLRLRAALGFTGNKSGANSYTSDVRPYYIIVPQEAARSASLPFVYEPDGIVEEAVSDGGTPYGVARMTDELLADWTHTFETKASTYTRYAASSAPWTWQDFFRHCRGQRPFAVYESALYNAVYKLRADGASFVPQPAEADYDAWWTIPIRARELGTL
jgi:hypothetical protein